MSPEEVNLPGDSLERLVTDLGVDLVQRHEDRVLRKTREGLREIDLQFQVTVSGLASKEPAFEPITIEFDYSLHYAPGQRESSLEYPHFTYGSQTNPAVAIHATVQEWLHDESNGAIIGAIVAIAAIGSDPFTGTVHLTFQGYGSRREPIVGE